MNASSGPSAAAHGERHGARALLRLAGPRPGERWRLALSVALASGAAAAAIGLLATSGYLISRAAQRPQILMLMVAIVGVRAFGIARALLRYSERLTAHDLAFRQLARLRLAFYRGLWPLVPGGLRGRSGDLLSRFVADVDTLQDLYPRVIVPVLVALLVSAGAALAAWIMLARAGIVVLASLTLAVLVLPWLSAVAAARSARRQAPARARLTSELIEAIDGASELALAGQAPAHARRLKRSDARLARIARGDALAVSAAAAGGGVLAAAGVLAVLAVGIPAVHSGALSGVLLAALVFLMLGAYESILPLSGAARHLRRCAAAATRLHELTALRAAVEDPPHARAPSAGGALAIEDLSFGYEAGEPLLLEHAKLRIAPGEHVALTGASGAGKSTIGELLVRFRDPVAGAVTLDGVDLRELSQDRIRTAVVLCAQDCHVFNTSIRENLLLARRDAGERELERVLATVELDGWVAGLEHGLDTLLGNNGELMSGGQRRRLALARALLTRARFLILDEPTAQLDPRLARRLIANLLDADGDRGLLVITHDPDALAGFDRVLSLSGGALREAEARHNSCATSSGDPLDGASARMRSVAHGGARR
jgi:thiol reductant ABC exporter CydC subunit